MSLIRPFFRNVSEKITIKKKRKKMISINKKRLALISFIILMSFSACAQANIEKDTKQLKVVFVYNGPIGDLGWIYAHEQGRKYLQENMPQIETTYIENVTEGGPEAERVIGDYAVNGYNLIFGTTYGYGDAIHAVAVAFPNVFFEHNTGYDIAPNVSTYYGRMYQARFLTGLVAGSMTKSNVIGFVGAFPIPQVVRGINAFALGVQVVNPDAKVHVVWTQSWFDPVLEREAAESLVNIGVDVIAQHENSAEAQKVAEENNIWGVGYNTDMSDQAPNASLTSAIWNWGPYYVKEAQAVLDGTWESKRYWGGLKDRIVDIAPYNDAVPQEVRDMVEIWRKKISETDWDVFEGPIYAQNGDLVLAEGVGFNDDYLLNEMDWFVQGVVGEAGALPPAVKP
jgi:basic membrane protein A and related proteins